MAEPEPDKQDPPAVPEPGWSNVAAGSPAAPANSPDQQRDYAIKVRQSLQDGTLQPPEPP